jgi:hypothetical protein
MNVFKINPSNLGQRVKLHDQSHPIPIHLTCLEDYSHMMMEMKLMVDGDDGDEYGGEDGLQSPPPREKFWIDLIPKLMIVAMEALCFMNSLCLIGHPLFDIYEGIRESWR